MKKTTIKKCVRILKNIILWIIFIIIFKPLIIGILFGVPYRYSKYSFFNFQRQESFVVKNEFKKIRNSSINEFLEHINQEYDLKQIENFFQQFKNNYEIKIINDENSTFLEVSDYNNQGVINFQFTDDKLELIETNYDIESNNFIKKYYFLIKKSEEIVLLKKFNSIDNNSNVKILIDNLGKPDMINIIFNTNFLYLGLGHRCMYSYLIKIDENYEKKYVYFVYDHWLYFKSVYSHKNVS